MSGGVDSAVAAARAAEAGHDVTGVHLALSKNPQTYRTGARGCCTVEDSRDARRAADVIGIPFYIWDMSERFHEEVVEDFYSEYAAGRTPNPCLRCNEKIKFQAVLDRAIALGFDAVVTGHYARKGDDGLLRRAIDPDKDQSYVLGVLTPVQLEHSMFPLGDTLKTDIRTEAEERDLAVARKPDSHDICFISNGDTSGFLKKKLGTSEGDIVDSTTGDVIGNHDGAHQFTIGQRHGLGLERPAADGKPRYVLSITPVENKVEVGPRDALRIGRIHTGVPVWLSARRSEPFRAEVQLRAHGAPVPATVTVTDDSLTAELDEPAYGVATGQTLVIYEPSDDGDAVLASGTIESTESLEGAGV